MANMDSTCFVFLCVVVASLVVGALAEPCNYNVVDWGAIGDGITDDKKVFLDVWEKACADPGSPTILVPFGKTFLLNPVKFNGPCSSPIHFQVDGNLMAPSEIWIDEVAEFGHCIEFNYIDGLVIDGNGQINGNGEAWWEYYKEQACSLRPDGLGILYCSNVTIRGLTFLDSPKEHLTINSTVGVHISDLTITAPGSSPNTDGIHFERSQHIQVMDLIIGTGDDCISIGNGTFDLNITRIICGPGHGISVGSLARDNTEAIVEDIHVSDCIIFNASNGVRIKTWQGRNSGYAKRMTFERIKLTLVDKPIIIDQYYCDKKCHICPTEISEFQVSDISYREITGTAVGPLAVIMNCNPVGCVGINMVDVDIRSASGSTINTSCVNVQGQMDDRVSPPVRCLN